FTELCGKCARRGTRRGSAAGAGAAGRDPRQVPRRGRTARLLRVFYVHPPDMRRLLPLCCLLFAGLLQAQPSQPLTLDRIMADPAWIGPPVEQAWWSWDGREVYYPLRRGDTRIQDLYAQPVDGGQARLLDG